MATRNRTEDYFQYRGTRGPKRRHHNDTDGLLGSDGNAGPSTTVVDVMPDWVMHMGTIRQVQRDVTVKMQELAQLHREHLTVRFGVARDEEAEEREIDTKTSAISAKFAEAEARIKQLDAVYKKDLDEEGGSDAELSILRNVKMCLVSEIATLGRGYRDQQRKYLSDLQKQKGVAKRWGGNDRISQLEEADKRSKMLEAGITPDQMESIALSEALAESEQQDYVSLLNSLKSLNEMFKDLYGLVIEQGTILDRIDYNMSLTHERVTKASAEIKKAAKHQEAGQFKLCVLLLVVLIMGFVIALLFKAAG